MTRGPSRGRALGAGLAFGVVAVAAASVAILDLFPGGRALPFAIALGAAGLGIAPAVSWRAGTVVAGHAVRGAALAVATFVLLDGLVQPFPAFAAGGALAVLGTTTFIVAVRLPGRSAPLAGVALAAALVVGAWWTLAPPVSALPGGLARGRSVFLAAVATLGATALARHLLTRGGRAVGGVAQAVTESELRNLLVVLPLTLVIAYRGVLASVLPHIQIYEWMLGLALAFYAVAALRARYRASAAEAPWSSDAARHEVVQEARPDPVLEDVVRTFAFVENGTDRARYEAFWRRVGPRSGVPESEVTTLLARLDADEPEAGRLWTRSRKAGDARAIRESVHRALLAHVENARGAPVEVGS